MVLLRCLSIYRRTAILLTQSVAASCLQKVNKKDIRSQTGQNYFQLALPVVPLCCNTFTAHASLRYRCAKHLLLTCGCANGVRNRSGSTTCRGASNASPLPGYQVLRFIGRRAPKSSTSL